MRSALPLLATCFLLGESRLCAQPGYLTYPVGNQPQGIAAADLNGDGKTDLVVANAGSNSITVLLNNGSGGFTALAPVTLGESPSPAGPNNTMAQIVTIADLNNDGKPDVLVLGAYFGPLNPGIGLLTLLGNGDGTFQAPQSVSNTGYGVALQVADFNGDGIPDLVIGVVAPGAFGTSAAVLFGNGDGTFRQGPNLEPITGTGISLAVGDFNGDGKPDIGAGLEESLVVFLNQGEGDFTATSNSVTWEYTPGGIAAADFNGDGLLDVAASTPLLSSQGVILPGGSLTIFLGHGDGTFKTLPSTANTGSGTVVTADLNGDGHPDLVTSFALPVTRPNPSATRLTFFAGRGDGSFEGGLPLGAGNTGYSAIGSFAGSATTGFAASSYSNEAGANLGAGTVIVLPQVEWPSLGLASVSAAGFGLGPQAPGSVATLLGSNLSLQSGSATTGTLPLTLAGVTVTVTGSDGNSFPAALYYVSPQQVNYVIPSSIASGPGTVAIASGGETTAQGQIDIEPVAPALFTVNSAGLAAAYVTLVTANGQQTFQSTSAISTNGSIIAVPIAPPPSGGTAYLSLFGTGIRNVSSLSAVSAAILSAYPAQVTYAGPDGEYDGLDQVNVLLPSSVFTIGAATLPLAIVVDGQPSNAVMLQIQ